MNTNYESTDFGATLCLFLVLNLLWFTHLRTTVGLQKELRYNEVFYPKHYISPPKRIRRIFNIKEKMIPKFLYYRLLFIGFGFIPFSVIWLVCVNLTNADSLARYWVFASFWCVVLCELFVFLFLCVLFKYKRSKVQQERMKKIKQKDKAEKKKRKQLANKTRNDSVSL